MTDPTDRDLMLARAVADAMLQNDKAAQVLGINLEEIRPGYARLSMIITPQMMSGIGAGHGGVTFTLADTAFAYACNSHNTLSYALQCSISYIKTVHPDDVLTAVAQEQSLTAKTGVYDVIVTNQAGETVALFRAASYRTRKPVLPVSG